MSSSGLVCVIIRVVMSSSGLVCVIIRVVMSSSGLVCVIIRVDVSSSGLVCVVIRVVVSVSVLICCLSSDSCWSGKVGLYGIFVDVDDWFVLILPFFASFLSCFSCFLFFISLLFTSLNPSSSDRYEAISIPGSESSELSSSCLYPTSAPLFLLMIISRLCCSCSSNLFSLSSSFLRISFFLASSSCFSSLVRIVLLLPRISVPVDLGHLHSYLGSHSLVQLVGPDTYPCSAL